MAVNPSLNGLKVLVTRPEQQAKELCDLIIAEGGEAIVFPVITIKAIPAQSWGDISIADCDMIIFVSRNAVSYFIEGLREKLSDNIQLVAIGSGTANVMSEYGLRVDIQPQSPAGSESLLAMPELNNVKDKQILIVRGQGGRELLADTLLARGAKISYVEVYQRQIPSPSNDNVELARTADCVVVTSVAGLNNLCQLIGGDTLKDKQLVVVSKRIKQHAVALGFQQIMIADDANDNAVMQKVRDGAKR